MHNASNSHYFIGGTSLINKENRIRDKFFEKFASEVGTLNTLLGQILEPKLELAQDDTGMGRFAFIFCSQNYSLLNNAIDLISRGYELESLLLLRPVAERAVLILYFCDFPEELRVYIKSHKKFYSRLRGMGYGPYMEGVMTRMEKEGRMFNDFDEPFWTREVYRSLIEEPSSLLHANLDAASVASMRGSRVISGPHYRVTTIRIILSKIEQSALWTLMSLITAGKLPTAYWEDLAIAHTIDSLYGTNTVQSLNSPIDGLL